MTFKNTRPLCPKCTVAMIVTSGFKLEPEQQTFECLRCGHVVSPQPSKQSLRRLG
jgi:hypothetical protein